MVVVVVVMVVVVVVVAVVAMMLLLVTMMPISTSAIMHLPGLLSQALCQRSLPTHPAAKFITPHPLPPPYPPSPLHTPPQPVIDSSSCR